MNIQKTAGAIAAFTAALAFSGPASSQLVLSCYTLHNDLANFDRRAAIARDYFIPGLERLREAAAEDAVRAGSATCFNRPTEECDAPPPVGTAERYRRLKTAYLLSHLGGADLVRLRIIHEMQKLGCPLPDHVVELLRLLEAQDRRDERPYRHHGPRAAEPSPLK